MILRFIPVAVVVFVFGTSCICLYLAFFEYKHVTYLWPYISDGGGYPPESCIFAQGLNIAAVLLLFVMYIKFKQVEGIYKKHNIVDKYHINKITFIVGVSVALGISIVANFQETNILFMHAGGAGFTFIGGSIYGCLQSYLYTKIAPVIGQKSITVFRIVLSVIAVATSIGYNVTGFLALSDFKGRDMTKWKPEHGGFEMHLISTIIEWICSFAVMAYILLFYEEFKYTKIDISVVYNDIRLAPGME